MSVNEKQMAAILALSPPKRYSHFIKKVVGWGEVWGLYDDGWATSESPDGRLVMPLWPEKEYAERCIEGEWSEFTALPIDLDMLLNQFIPNLREQNILPGIFFDPEIGSINCSLDDLERDLKDELEKYI